MNTEDVTGHGGLSAAQLDALPVGACVIDYVGDVFTKRVDRFWYLDDDFVPYVSAEIASWEPELAA